MTSPLRRLNDAPGTVETVSLQHNMEASLDAVWTALATGGPWGLIALFVVAVWRGWLIPAAQADRVEKMLTQRAEDFKAAWQLAEERGRVRDEHVDKLLTTTENQEALLKSIVRTADAKGPTT